MFGVFKRQSSPQHIDLASVRDTLLYIESDLDHAPELERLATAIRSALAEIDRIELSDRTCAPLAITASRFLPTRL